MEKEQKVQMLADQIQSFLVLVDGLAENLEQEDIELLKEAKSTLLNHISMQEAAVTLTMAFGFSPNTTEEKFKAKTLDALIELINVRKDYKTAMIENAENQKKMAQNRAELMNIFGNL